MNSLLLVILVFFAIFGFFYFAGVVKAFVKLFKHSRAMRKLAEERGSSGER